MRHFFSFLSGYVLSRLTPVSWIAAFTQRYMYEYGATAEHLGQIAIAQRKFAVTERFLGYLGVEPERLKLAWVSGSEGKQFASEIDALVERVKRIGPAKRLVKNA